MRSVLRPLLLEFFRAHLILTAAGALLTVVFMTLGTLLGVGALLETLAPEAWTGASRTAAGALPGLLPLFLSLLAYLPAGRLARKRTGLERPGAAEALLLLLLPAGIFWSLLLLANFLPNGSGLLVAACLLNCPAYGLLGLLPALTGWGLSAPAWVGYLSGLVSGLLPPLLFLTGSCLPIRAIDRLPGEDQTESQ